MLIDCGVCEVRGDACPECVVTVLWGLPDDGAVTVGERRRVVLDGTDRHALRALADAGLAPPLRHVRSGGTPVSERTGRSGAA